MRAIYSILLYLLWPVVLLVTLRDAYRRQGGLRYVSQRMGWRGASVGSEGASIWFHAASVGEVQSLFPLLERLLASSGGAERNIYVSVNTPEAHRLLTQFLVKTHLHTFISCGFCPVDFYYSTRRYVNAVDAEQLCVVETEIWPNLFTLARRRDMRVGIINGRISKNNRDPGLVLRRIYQTALSNVDWLAARSREDAQAYSGLGVAQEKLSLPGNLKRCSIQHSAAEIPTALQRRDYVLVISSRPKEEQIIWRCWCDQDVRPLLVIAPRHLQRLDEVRRSLKSDGASVIDLKDLSAADNPDVVLVDSMGQISNLLDGANWAMVGGSFSNYGGHNVLEPALAGRFVLVGPHVDNIREDIDWLCDLGVAIKLESNKQMASEFRTLIATKPVLKADVAAISAEILERYVALVLQQI